MPRQQRFRSRGLGAPRGTTRRSIRRAQWRVWHSRTRVVSQPLPPSLPLAAARCLTWRPLSFSLLFAPQSHGSLQLYSPTLLAFCSLSPSLELSVARSSFRAFFIYEVTRGSHLNVSKLVHHCQALYVRTSLVAGKMA